MTDFPFRIQLSPPQIHSDGRISLTLIDPTTGRPPVFALNSTHLLKECMDQLVMQSLSNEKVNEFLEKKRTNKLLEQLLAKQRGDPLFYNKVL
jgi:hypothetical protein